MVVQLLSHITLFTLLWWSMSNPVLAQPPISKPNCQSNCGGIEIPYPFGIGTGCYINDGWFQIICDNSTENPKPFLNRTNLEVLEISVEEGTLKVKNPITFSNCTNKPNSGQTANLEGTPFAYSQKNIFTAVGCGVMATITSNSNGDTISSGCKSECSISTNNSSGHNSCQTALPSFLFDFNTSFQIFENQTRSSCNYAFLADRDWFANNSRNFSAIRDMDNVPVVLEWSLFHSSTDVYGTFLEVNATMISSRPICDTYNDSYSINESLRLKCSCGGGYEGNPYLLEGCQDINECELPTRCFEPNICMNVNGGYGCSPPPKSNSYNDSSSIYESLRLECYCEFGFEGNPYLLDGCQDINECELLDHHCSEPFVCVNSAGDYGCYPPPKSNSKVKVIFIGIGSGLGFLFLLIASWWLSKVIKKRKAIKRKAKLFKQNGGLLLEQQLSSGEVNVEKIKLFNSKELETATDHFNVDRILGQGGQGTVYKGMLTDGRIVAVKKSKVVDGGEVAQFINEIVILSQINHRNVVMLLGCCLETEVPLLVYEFIPKGTIYQYLHQQNEEFLLKWQMRLRIAAEVAGALSYLHSAAGFPIYHRDIKSTNILLDEKYRAKVADFGTSRSVSIEQTHLTTIVHGTFGYLDPEYFQSSQFTEKSDVYSFGVVLAELLTGEKPVSLARSPEARGLVTYFNFSMEENRLLDIVDARVKEEGVTEDIMAVATLAKRCLELSGKRRPTMKEVAMELEAIQKSLKGSKLQQNQEEVEYVRNEVICDCPWDVASESTGSGLDCVTASSKDSLPLLSY
ncbi:wall-associated receptor kinase-like 2 [Prunus avium]|uniref:Wall-associated receptor kinase-like 2 n=1 Tax=Prunus avium TaxID=42229 RepID=A0A6P5RMS4_PRUAV|nr:wall-associated receptor kinase-like 2 [Prunus avium]